MLFSHNPIVQAVGGDSVEAFVDFGTGGSPSPSGFVKISGSGSVEISPAGDLAASAVNTTINMTGSRDRGAVAGTGLFNDMYRSFVFNGTSTTITADIDSLDSNTDYIIRVWMLDDADPTVFTTMTPSITTGTLVSGFTPATSVYTRNNTINNETDFSCLATVASDGSGNISILVTGTGGDLTAKICGFRIVGA